MALALKKWPRRGVTFETTHGAFVLPAQMIERADLTGDDFEIRRLFARAIPAGASVHRRERAPGGALRIYWRIVRVIPAPRRGERG